MCEDVENVEREARLDRIVAYLHARYQDLAQRGDLNGAEQAELRDLMLHGFDKPVKAKRPPKPCDAARMETDSAANCGVRAMTDGETSNIKVTKLPPGKAYGADDLRNWASRRAAGRSGVFDNEGFKKQRKVAKKLRAEPLK